MKNNKNMERIKRDAENLAESTKEAFVDYVNNLADKAQRFTAEKLEKIEDKTKKGNERRKSISRKSGKKHK